MIKALSVRREALALGPDSTRGGAPITGDYLIPVPGPRLSDDQIERIAGALVPQGPRPAIEILELLDRRVVFEPPAEEDDAPALILIEGIVTCPVGAGSERRLLEAAAELAIQRARLASTPEDVRAVVARLARPALVRLAPGS